MDRRCLVFTRTLNLGNLEAAAEATQDQILSLIRRELHADRRYAVTVELVGYGRYLMTNSQGDIADTLVVAHRSGLGNEGKVPW